MKLARLPQSLKAKEGKNTPGFVHMLKSKKLKSYILMSFTRKLWLGRFCKRSKYLYFFNKHPCSFWGVLAQGLWEERFWCLLQHCYKDLCAFKFFYKKNDIHQVPTFKSSNCCWKDLFVWNPNRSKYCFYYSLGIYMILTFHFTLNRIL